MNCLLPTQVGYFDNGELILDPKRIACRCPGCVRFCAEWCLTDVTCLLPLFRYLRTWFLPDLIVVLPDWFTRVVDTEGGDGLATASWLQTRCDSCRSSQGLTGDNLQRYNATT